MKSLLFTDPMVRAILDGRKTMARRLVPSLGTYLPWEYVGRLGEIHRFSADAGDSFSVEDLHPKLLPGETFYVREAWRKHEGRSGDEQWGMEFRASTKLDFVATAPRWRSPLHLREADARLFLRCTDVWAERVQDISEEDAKREGVTPNGGCSILARQHVREFGPLWASIHGEESWHANPWVWVYSFEKISNPNPTEE